LGLWPGAWSDQWPLFDIIGTWKRFCHCIRNYVGLRATLNEGLMSGAQSNRAILLAKSHKIGLMAFR
jgi:hypothetical protein